MHSRVSYKTVAISLPYLYSKSCVAIIQHRRTTAASLLQNGISRNTKCDIMVGFPKSGHTYQHQTAFLYMRERLLHESSLTIQLRIYKRIHRFFNVYMTHLQSFVLHSVVWCVHTSIADSNFRRCQQNKISFSFLRTPAGLY